MNTLDVAFATSDGTKVDQHFGWCCRFDVYEVSAEGSRFRESRLLPAAPDDEGDKIASRLRAIQGCAMVYLTSIGGTAAARVVKARIHPVKLREGEAIALVLDRLAAVLSGTPPPWMRKLLRHGEGEGTSFTG